MCILPNITCHEDLVQLNDAQRVQLCREIREFLVSSISQTGGHLASNLGAVELTVAIETVFDTMKDRLVFDVGHQSYVHKMLTGRQAGFLHLRQFGGMSGFPKPYESCADAFVAGHASSSVSVALGMARARSLTHQDYQVVALLGDGAATGGMVFEAMNDAAVSKEPMVIILNDNAMSIDRNVGGLSRHLSRLRSSNTYLHLKKVYRRILMGLPGGKPFYAFSSRVKNCVKRIILPETIFENMGMTYYGPIDGHDLPTLLSVLRSAREIKGPVVVHVMTQKGHGYAPAEQHPSKFHGIGKFDPETGKTPVKKEITFSDILGETLIELAQMDERVCTITAAMPGGTGLLKFRDSFPQRTFDVGIAEEHAVSMAGGLAKQGMIPVVAIYSTFLQRAYDQIMQDVAMLGLHVVFAVDRAGLVGEDGETHHGIFDVGYLRQAPGMMVLCPVCLAEQRDMLRWAVEECTGPVAVRYPRGSDGACTESAWEKGISASCAGVLKCHRTGEDVTLVTYGRLLNNVMEAAQILEDAGIHAAVLRLLTIAPLPVEEILRHLSARHQVIVVEEASSGIRQELACLLEKEVPDCRVDGIDLGKRFIPHGDMASLYRFCGLDGASIAAFTREVLGREG